MEVAQGGPKGRGETTASAASGQTLNAKAVRGRGRRGAAGTTRKEEWSAKTALFECVHPSFHQQFMVLGLCLPHPPPRVRD